MAIGSDSPNGFGSPDQVMSLFTDPYITLAGWLHYLAFDLFVSAWIVRSAREEGISHWLLLPILYACYARYFFRILERAANSAAGVIKTKFVLLQDIRYA